MLEVESQRALLVDLYELTMAAAYFEQQGGLPRDI